MTANTLSPQATAKPTGRRWKSLLAQAFAQGEGDRPIIVSRAAGNDGEHVFIEFDGVLHWLTPVQAADLAEALREVSGMASSSGDARFLAESVNRSLFDQCVSKARLVAETGITRYRLRKILSAEAPMTLDELKAISAVKA